MGIHQISLTPSSVARALATVASLLVLASIAGQLTAYLAGRDLAAFLKPRADRYVLVWLFNLDAERNIPTGFSTLLLILAALLLALITVLTRKHTRPFAWQWAILAFGFLVMAADEAWSFHEKSIKPLRRLLGDSSLGVFYNAWVIPGIAVVLVVALLFSSFLLRLPAKTRLAFVTAATLYIGGAIGVELIGGRLYERHGHTFAYSMITTVEESLEMAGVIVFIRALLVYIAGTCDELRFRLEGGALDVMR